MNPSQGSHQNPGSSPLPRGRGRRREIRRRREGRFVVLAPGVLILALLRRCHCLGDGPTGYGPPTPYIPGSSEIFDGRAQVNRRLGREIGTVVMPDQYTSFDPYSPSYGNGIEDTKPSFVALRTALDSQKRSELAEYVGRVLQKLANTNELFHGGKRRKEKDSPFHFETMPQLSIADFVMRVAKHVSCPNICLLLTLVYMDRLTLPSSEQHVYVTPLTAHKLFIGSLIIALKFIEVEKLAPAPTALARGMVNEAFEVSGESAQKNQPKFGAKFYGHLSSVTGMTVNDLKLVEHDMLQALSTKVSVSYEEIVRYMGGLLVEPHEVVPYVDRPYEGGLPPPFQ